MKNLVFLIALIFLFIYSETTFSQAPVAPTNLQVNYIFLSALSLSWTDNSSNETGFIIERSTDSKSWNIIKSLILNSTNYADIGLILNTKYYYRIYAFNASGNSAFSNIVSATPTNMFSCGIGTDTISTPYPFYTTYTDSRTQMLYKKSEMFGYCSVGYIWDIDFYYKGTTTLTVSNCTIKMKSTNDTMLTKFIDTGWTTVYNNQPITFSYQGWKYIFLNPTFVWDINKNILIDICFHSATSIPVNVLLRSSVSQNKVWHNHKNLSNGCTLDSGSAQTLRPNIQFGNVIDGVRKISENTPANYSIEQNYPNPFNGSTKFKFKIKETGPVTLSLYDVLGRQEVVVFSEPLTAGEYEKTFSLSEHPLPSGIYYYVFVTKDLVSVKKMVILK